MGVVHANAVTLSLTAVLLFTNYTAWASSDQLPSKIETSLIYLLFKPTNCYTCQSCVQFGQLLYFIKKYSKSFEVFQPAELHAESGPVTLCPVLKRTLYKFERWLHFFFFFFLFFHSFNLPLTRTRSVKNPSKHGDLRSVKAGFDMIYFLESTAELHCA